MGGAGGRALRLFPFAFGKRSGLRAPRLGGAAPAPGSRCPAGGRREAGGGRGQAGGRRGARGARTAQRWDFSAREESGAGARPRRGSADSGAAGAGGGGGGEAAGTQEAGESRSRPASMGRLAPRPLLLALLWLGECARGLAGRGGRGRGSAGAQLGHAAWSAGVPGGSRERRRGPRAARAGGERRGAARSRARIRPGRSARPRLAPPVPGGRGGVARGRPPPALPTCWPLGARLTLNSGPGRCPRSPGRVRSRGAEICAFDVPRRSRDRPTRPWHMPAHAELPFQGRETIRQLPSTKVTGWPRALGKIGVRVLRHVGGGSIFCLSLFL